MIEVTRYAIHLPDGKLFDEIPPAGVHGGPEFARLSDNFAVYLWRDANSAERTIQTWASTLSDYGLVDVYPALAKVVEVRINIEIRDVAEAAADGESVGEREPRTWQSAGDVPSGVKFKAAGYVLSPVWCHINGNSLVQLGTAPATDKPVSVSDVDRIWNEGNGFVEVQPDHVAESEVVAAPEPRRWRTVTEIPIGTRFRTSTNPTGSTFRRTEEHCLHLESGATYGFGSFGAAIDGYIEVLP